ncbi:hypothetical protein ACIOVF_17300 [Pseudomonas sp. NPDC087612]|uniref:hypothetical protein n=1 Tax=Pseudomonas sp. NPDC087612 TaxID=3364441 RepID=UPI0037FB8AE1
MLISKSLEIKVGERYTLRGRNYQIEAIDGDEVQLRGVDGPCSVTFQTLAALQRAHDRGHLRKIQEAPFSMSPEKIVAGLNKSQAEKFKIRNAYIQTITHSYNGIFSRSDFTELQAEVTKWIGEHVRPAYSTVSAWRRRYLKAGGNPVALLPNTYKPHRKHLSNQPEGVQKLIIDTLEEVYWVTTPFSKKDTSTAIQLAVKDENKYRSARSKYKIPSLSTLWRIICEQDHHRTLLKQKGVRIAAKAHHAGGSLPEPTRLFELVEADSQMLHLFAFDERSGVVAKPHITIFLEIKCRYVIAWHISFDPPSEDTTLLTLKKAISSSNPYGGAAERYTFDNGPENVGEDLRHQIELYLGEASFCEPYTPNEKARIERMIKTFTLRLIHRMKGTTFSNPVERGDYDSAKNAHYTIDQLRHYFSEYIERYHNEYHSTLEMSPNEAWSKCQKLELEPRRFSEDDLRRLFWRKVVVTPHNGRVRAHNLLWHGAGVAELANRYPASKTLDLYFDPCDVGQACVCHPKYPQDKKTVDPLRPAYQSGLTLSFHRLIHARKLELRQQKKYVSANEAMVQLLLEIARENAAAGNKVSGKTVTAKTSTGNFGAPLTPDAQAEHIPEKSHDTRKDTPEDFAVRKK